jgi:hypothetical protein
VIRGQHREQIDHRLAGTVVGEVTVAPDDVEQLRQRVLVEDRGDEGVFALGAYQAIRLSRLAARRPSVTMGN